MTQAEKETILQTALYHLIRWHTDGGSIDGYNENHRERYAAIAGLATFGFNLIADINRMEKATAQYSRADWQRLKRDAETQDYLIHGARRHPRRPPARGQTALNFA